MLFYYALSPAALLWIVVATVILFVAAPHLELASKPAARTLRIGAIALIVWVLVPIGFMFARIDAEQLFAYAQAPLMFVFWGSLALAAWQIVQGAPRKGGLL